MRWNLWLAGFGAVLIGASTSTRGAEDGAEFMAQAVGRVAASVRLAGRQLNLGYREGLSLLGSYNRVGTFTTFGTDFHMGHTYVITAGGDDDATDVDLEIRDPDGRVLADDKGAGPSSVLSFTCKRRGYHEIKLTLHGSRATHSFCAMTILQVGGWDVPPLNMVESVAKILAAKVVLAEQGHRLKFLDQPNQWSLFGGVLPKSESIQVYKMTLGRGRRVFIAAGDRHADDIDAYLQSNHRTIVSDEEADPHPLLEHYTDNRIEYSFKITNAQADGPSMIVGIVLSAEEDRKKQQIGALQPADAGIMLTGRKWTVTATDQTGASWGGATLNFTTQNNTPSGDLQLEGHFDWVRNGVFAGRELFRGTFSAGDRMLTLRGHQVTSPTTLAIGIYTARLLESGNTFVQGGWAGVNGDGIPGRWSASNAP